MLPARAYSDRIVSLPVASGEAADPLPVLIAAVASADFQIFPTTAFSAVAARTTSEAIQLIERERPRLVALDWDSGDLDGRQICAVARRRFATGILVIMSTPHVAPSALKAGCHGVLLRPLTTNLIAARLGRLARELPTDQANVKRMQALGQFGTNQICPEVACPTCRQPGAVAFEHSSRRHDWYACPSCEAVWRARREE